MVPAVEAKKIKPGSNSGRGAQKTSRHAVKTICSCPRAKTREPRRYGAFRAQRFCPLITISTASPQHLGREAAPSGARRCVTQEQRDAADTPFWARQSGGESIKAAGAILSLSSRSLPQQPRAPAPPQKGSAGPGRCHTAPTVRGRRNKNAF